MPKLIFFSLFLFSCQNKSPVSKVINAQDYWKIVCAIHDKYPFLEDTTINKIIFIGIRTDGNVKDLETIKEMGSNIACLNSEVIFLSQFPSLDESMYDQVYNLFISKMDKDGMIRVGRTNHNHLTRKWVPGDDPTSRWEYKLKKTNGNWKLIGEQKSLDAWDDIEVAPKQKQ